MDPQEFDIHTFLQLKDMMNEIATLFHSLRDDKKVRAVILTGSGDKAFSAGVDLLKADARSLNHNGAAGWEFQNERVLVGSLLVQPLSVRLEVGLFLIIMC